MARKIRRISSPSPVRKIRRITVPHDPRVNVRFVGEDCSFKYTGDGAMERVLEKGYFSMSRFEDHVEVSFCRESDTKIMFSFFVRKEDMGSKDRTLNLHHFNRSEIKEMIRKEGWL